MALLKQGGLIGYLALVLFLAVLWLLVASPSIQHGITMSASDLETLPDRTAFQLALDRYGAVVRNMTMRLYTAERVLARLRAERDAAKAKRSSKESKSDDEEWADPEDVETDEQRLARQKEEEKEQLTLIGYNQSSGKFRRYRPDFRCGNRVPVLPDNEVVECEPSGEAPCCSAMGWCGKSKQHCSCEMCSDYRPLAKLKLLGIKLTAPQRECQQIAFNFGPQKSAQECAQLVFPHVECGRSFMISETYPDWGCRCCAALSGPSDEVKKEWKVYTLQIKVESVSEGGPTAGPATDPPTPAPGSSSNKGKKGGGKGGKGK